MPTTRINRGFISLHGNVAYYGTTESKQVARGTPVVTFASVNKLQVLIRLRLLDISLDLLKRLQQRQRIYRILRHPLNIISHCDDFLSRSLLWIVKRLIVFDVLRQIPAKFNFNLFLIRSQEGIVKQNVTANLGP